MVAVLTAANSLIQHLSPIHVLSPEVARINAKQVMHCTHTGEVSLGLEKIKLKRFKTSLASWFSQIVCFFSTPFCVVNSHAFFLINFLKFEYKLCMQINRWLLQNKTVSLPLVLIHQDRSWMTTGYHLFQVLSFSQPGNLIPIFHQEPFLPYSQQMLLYE